MMKNIVLCGIGGQGTVLASKLIASAAMSKNIPVMSAETIGMAQRGGNVFSNLRMGEGVHSPMIAKGQADIILGFEPGETVRMLPFLKADGVVVTNKRAIMPTTATLSGFHYDADEMIDYLKTRVNKLHVIDGDEALKELGSSKVLNIVLLGAALRTKAIELSEEDIICSMEKMLKPEFMELNKKAIYYTK
ncbi:MAG: indolepyruvate oxidoreductase subunit beta [Lachnospiraceae bacterium]|nr:indolepyruvate oxidoreductase subunit beta [Lachnospiraceae bacterium]